MPHFFDKMCLGVHNVKFVDKNITFSTKNSIIFFDKILNSINNFGYLYINANLGFSFWSLLTVSDPLLTFKNKDKTVPHKTKSASCRRHCKKWNKRPCVMAIVSPVIMFGPTNLVGPIFVLFSFIFYFTFKPKRFFLGWFGSHCNPVLKCP